MTGRRLCADASFRLPDLRCHLPKHGRILTRAAVVTHAATYDTPDGRLAAAGVSCTRAEDAWTVVLPVPGHPASRSVTVPGAPWSAAEPAVPAELVGLLTAVTRGAPLTAVSTRATTRTRIELRDRDDVLLAELTDAVVTAPGRDGVTRYLTLAPHAVTAKRFDRLVAALRDAGAVLAPERPREAKRHGDVERHAEQRRNADRHAQQRRDAERHADENRKPGRGKGKPAGRAAEVVTAVLRADVAAIVGHDPLVRLRATLPDGDTAVHQTRVAVRRLRADLTTFGPLLADAWTRPLRGELAWLAGALGAARDAEVLRTRLRRTAAADPLSPLDPIALARIDADLAARAEDARIALDAVLASGRYRALHGTLHALATDPPLTRAARAPRSAADPRRLAGSAWRRLERASAALGPMAPDDDWHAARKRARYARYAADGVDPGSEVASALAAVCDLLGAHSDAALAGRVWLEIAAADPDDHVLAVTAGRLHERERAVVADVRRVYPPLWRVISRAKLAEWVT